MKCNSYAATVLTTLASDAATPAAFGEWAVQRCPPCVSSPQRPSHRSVMHLSPSRSIFQRAHIRIRKRHDEKVRTRQRFVARQRAVANAAEAERAQTLAAQRIKVTTQTGAQMAAELNATIKQLPVLNPEIDAFVVALAEAEARDAAVAAAAKTLPAPIPSPTALPTAPSPRSPSADTNTPKWLKCWFCW